MNNASITQSELKDVLHYNPCTGFFTWKNWANLPSNRRSKKGPKAGSLSNGYVQITINKKHYSGHRLAWLYVYGCFPDGQIDHINQEKSDNRIDNLRDVPASVNMKNQKKHKTNTSGITGVSWQKSSGKWCAQIGSRNLGYFACKFRAASVRHFAMEIEGGYTKRHGV